MCMVLVSSKSNYHDMTEIAEEIIVQLYVCIMKLLEWMGNFKGSLNKKNCYMCMHNACITHVYIDSRIPGNQRHQITEIEISWNWFQKLSLLFLKSKKSMYWRNAIIVKITLNHPSIQTWSKSGWLFDFIPVILKKNWIENASNWETYCTYIVHQNVSDKIC